MYCDVCKRDTEHIPDEDGNQYCVDPQHDARMREELFLLQLRGRIKENGERERSERIKQNNKHRRPCEH